MEKPRLANCKLKDVLSALRKLGGFTFGGKKHYKVTHIQIQKASTIPRGNPINRNLLKDFVEDYLVKELDFPEEKVYKYLWC